MATTNKVKGWSGVLMTEDSSSHWPTKRRHVYSETSRRAGLKFVCVFGYDGIRPKHSLLLDKTNPFDVSVQIRRTIRQPNDIRSGVLEADLWWALSRLPVVTRRLTDLASGGEQRVLS